MDEHPDQARIMADMGIGKTGILLVSVLSIAVGIMILFPQVFFAANLINAATVLLIIALSLQSGNTETALIKIPFLIMPLLLIWLRHPLKEVKLS